MPAVRRAFEIAKRYRGFDPDKVTSHYLTGMLYAAFFAEAIRLAMEKVGYENLTGKAVRDAIVTIENWEHGFGPPTTTTDEQPYVMSAGVRIAQVREGKTWAITDWVPYAFHYPELTKGR